MMKQKENKRKGIENILNMIINIVAAFAGAALFIGAIIAIWGGFIGVQVALSATVLLVGDYVIYFLLKTFREEKQKRSGER